ncbi:MAG TPA: efflux RND transporter periplasmic adaptor subunit [Kineobactrum sp.]
MRAYLIATLLLIAIFGAISGYLYNRISGLASQDFAPPPLIVAAAIADTARWPETLAATGTIRSRRGVELSTEESGEIIRIDVRSGDTVRTGQLLIQLNDRAEVASRERQRAAVELARLLFERDAKLLQQKSVPQSQYDRSRANLDVALAELSETEALLAYKALRAPFDGTVGIIDARVGDYVNAGTRIASLQDLAALEVDFTVPARYAPQLRSGLELGVTVPGFGDRVFRASLQSLDTEVDEDTRSLLLRASIEPATGLLPGMFASITIDLGRALEQVSVPETAITHATVGSTLYVIESSAEGLQAIPRVVRTGAAKDGRIAIIEGLEAGERVVIAGQNKLFRGAVVEIDDHAPL